MDRHRAIGTLNELVTEEQNLVRTYLLPAGEREVRDLGTVRERPTGIDDVVRASPELGVHHEEVTLRSG